VWLVKNFINQVSNNIDDDALNIETNLPRMYGVRMVENRL